MFSLFCKGQSFNQMYEDRSKEYFSSGDIKIDTAKQYYGIGDVVSENSFTIDKVVNEYRIQGMNGKLLAISKDGSHWTIYDKDAALKVLLQASVYQMRPELTKLPTIYLQRPKRKK